MPTLWHGRAPAGGVVSDFTPGPWRLCRMGTHEFDVVCMAGNQFRGTFLGITLGNGAPETPDYDDAAEFQANARLIAAAPEMFRLLSEIYGESGPDNQPREEIWCEVKRLIDKVEEAS